MRTALRNPSGLHRGIQKQLEPPGAAAEGVRKPSDMGAEQNHLWPVIRNSRPPLPIGAGFARATVELARTSEPPCFSVMVYRR